MPGIDPALLPHIGNSMPGGPPAGAPKPPGAAPPAGKAEPTSLHEQCEQAAELVGQARDLIEEFAASAELAADVDPKVEKAAIKAAELIAQIDDEFATVVEILSKSKQEHDDMIAGKGDGAPPA